MTTMQTETPSGLLNLYRTLDDGTEVLGAFLSVTRSGEKVLASLMQAADKTVLDLAAWRAALKGVSEILGVTEVH